MGREEEMEKQWSTLYYICVLAVSRPFLCVKTLQVKKNVPVSCQSTSSV